MKQTKHDKLSFSDKKKCRKDFRVWSKSNFIKQQVRHSSALTLNWSERDETGMLPVTPGSHLREGFNLNKHREELERLEPFLTFYG